MQGGWGNQNQGGGWGDQNSNQGGWGNQQQSNQGWGNQQQQSNQGGWGGQQQQGGDNWTGNMGFISGASQWGNNLNGSQWVQEQTKRQQNLNFFDPNNNFSGQFQNMIEQQVIFVEPSPSKKLLEELKQKGQVFRDDRFPPNQNSLTGESGPQANWSKIKWDKISSATPGAKIFQGKCEPGDIKQGYLGDCYFLAALAALAERPDRIFKLFLLTEENAQKYYSVKMLYKGKWMTIDMDQYIPYLYNEPAFTKAKENELWVVLLEKAWAKLYSNYKRIEAGYPEEGLHDLTGAPIRNIYLKQAGFDKERQWQYLLQASQREYAMVTSSQPGSDTNKSYRGVVQGHAYTFLNATYLNFQGQKIRVVQLRNPWGKGQAKGDWSDEDPKWNQVDPQEKQRLGFNLNKEDGIFFMTYEDFLDEFRAIAVCEVNDEASYVYKSVKDPQNKGVFFKVEVPRPGNYSLQIDKTPERSYIQSIQEKFQYPNAKIDIGLYQNGQVQRLEPAASNKRTTSKLYNLQQGIYIVRVQIDYSAQLQRQFDVNLAVYGEYPVQIKIASKQQASALTPGCDWSGVDSNSNNNSWNPMGNQEWYQQQGGGNNGGWGQQGGNNGGNGNNGGWGQQQQGGGGNNGGWGGQQQQQGGNNGGWGQQQQPGNNNGWGGQQQQQQGGNNGGWGGQQQQGGGNNGGWGGQQQGGNNGGWGQQNNGGWGQQQQPGNNNGWGGQQGGNNNGW